MFLFRHFFPFSLCLQSFNPRLAAHSMVSALLRVIHSGSSRFVSSVDSNTAFALVPLFPLVFLPCMVLSICFCSEFVRATSRSAVPDCPRSLAPGALGVEAPLTVLLCHGQAAGHHVFQFHPFPAIIPSATPVRGSCIAAYPGRQAPSAASPVHQSTRMP
jgi:hypothetical protein